MKQDLLRLFCVILIAISVGLIAGNLFLCLISGLLLFIFWQYTELSKILRWLKKRQDVGYSGQPGIVDDICREIESLRKRNSTRKNRLNNFLKRFQEAANTFPDAVVVLEESDTIEWANKNSKSLLGVDSAKDSGLKITNLLRDPIFIDFMKHDIEEKNKPIKINSPIDDKKILEIRISPYGLAQKLLIARNVTHINQLDKMRKDFIANSSHELRTPLTAISGFIEGFINDDNCPKGWRSYLDQMRRQSFRMQRLIDDLLKLSSLESTNKIIDKEQVPVADILSNVIDEAEVLSGMMRHKFIVNVDKNLYLIGNQKEIFTIFSNLVFNAIQYTPENGQIDVTWQLNNNNAVFTVKDNGIGIDEKNIARLTERFYRVDTGRSREIGGTGLGLALVKHGLAKYESGLIIKSKLNEGSSFSCQFSEKYFICSKLDEEKRISI